MECYLLQGREFVHRVSVSDNPANGGPSYNPQQPIHRQRLEEAISTMSAPRVYEKHGKRRGHADQRNTT